MKFREASDFGAVEAWREICYESNLRNLDCILVIELTRAPLAADWTELEQKLAAPPAPAAAWRLRPTGDAFSRVLAFSRKAYQRLADEIPASSIEGALWLRQMGRLDEYVKSV